MGRQPACSCGPGPTAPPGDRLRAIEQLESRALVKPKKTVEQVNPNAELDRKLDAMNLDELRQLAARRPAEVQFTASRSTAPTGMSLAHHRAPGQLDRGAEGAARRGPPSA